MTRNPRDPWGIGVCAACHWHTQLWHYAPEQILLCAICYDETDAERPRDLTEAAEEFGYLAEKDDAP